MHLFEEADEGSVQVLHGLSGGGWRKKASPGDTHTQNEGKAKEYLEQTRKQENNDDTEGGAARRAHSCAIFMHEASSLKNPDT